MRTCKKCGIAKPETQYEETNKERGWRRHECKQCVLKRAQDYAAKSKQQIYNQEYYRENRDQIIARVNEWVAQNPEKRKRNALAHYYRMQDAAIKAYGGYRCACCGETQPMFICLDHVNNDGRAHRKEIGTLGGAKLYKWLRDNNYPSGFQVLCMNCNHGKYRNGGVCPHKMTV